MQRDKRLERLEATVGRAALDNIPDSEVGDYCNTCLGPGAYRRQLDAARAQLFAEGWDGISCGLANLEAEDAAVSSFLDGQDARADTAFVCRGCGGETMEAAIARIRREAGLP
jgi:hypothetical protein